MYLRNIGPLTEISTNGERKTFAAKLNTVDGEKPELKNKEQADEILKRLEGAEFVIDKVKRAFTENLLPHHSPPRLYSRKRQDVSVFRREER